MHPSFRLTTSPVLFISLRLFLLTCFFLPAAPLLSTVLNNIPDSTVSVVLCRCSPSTTTLTQKSTSTSTTAAQLRALGWLTNLNVHPWSTSHSSAHWLLRPAYPVVAARSFPFFNKTFLAFSFLQNLISPVVVQHRRAGESSLCSLTRDKAYFTELGIIPGSAQTNIWLHGGACKRHPTIKSDLATSVIVRDYSISNAVVVAVTTLTSKGQQTRCCTARAGWQMDRKLRRINCSVLDSIRASGCWQ